MTEGRRLRLRRDGVRRAVPGPHRPRGRRGRPRRRVLGWREKNLDAIEAAASDAGLPFVGCTAGGVLTDPAASEETIATVEESIDTAKRLGCPSLIVTTGPNQEGIDRATQRQAVVDVLSAVAPAAESAGSRSSSSR